jgi:hypothetical protein
MSANGPPVLDVDNAAFITSGVAVSVASSNAARVPSVVRACGCLVSPDRRRVTVFVSPAQGSALLADLRAGGPLAAVFSLPSSHRTIQLKAPGALVSPCGDHDRLEVERYVRLLSADLDRIGHGGSFAAALLEVAHGSLAAVSFEPTEAYAQTPGPKAGSRLGQPP